MRTLPKLLALLPVLVCAAAPSWGASDTACLDARRRADARNAAAGLPYVRVDAEAQPESEGRVAQNLRVGLEMNLADLARRGQVEARAQSDCARFQAEDAAATFATASRTAVEMAGLEARKAALDAAVASAAATVAEREQKLASFGDTRAGVSRAAQELGTQKLDLIETAARLEATKRLAALYPKARREPIEVIQELTRATAEARVAEAAELRGPAWDLTLGGGWAKSRFQDETGARTHSTGRPLYAALGFRWRPAVALAALPDPSDAAKATRLEASVATWDADRRSMAQELTAKLALADERMQQLDADLARVVDGKTAEMRDYQSVLRREQRALQVDRSDWLAQRTALAGDAPAAAAPVTTDAKAPVVAPPVKDPVTAPPALAKLEALTVTEGAAKSTGKGFFVTRGARIRARADAGNGAAGVRAEFTYQGPSDDAKPLASGAERRQLGVFLAARNQCNLLYVMWRLPLKGEGTEGPGEIVVQRKVNPGASTHAACGNDGYETIKAKGGGAVPTLVRGERRSLEAALSASRLTVRIGDEIVWQGDVDLAGLDTATGSVGWRSDNVVAEFSLSRVEVRP